MKGSVYTDSVEELTYASGNDLLDLTGATIEGAVMMGNGDDTLNYNGSDNLVAGEMDGESGTDTINFNGYSGNAIGNYTNFEHVNLNNSTFDMGSGFVTPSSLTFNVDGGSTLIMKGGGGGAYAINANVTNEGVFDFADGAVGDSLSVNGNLASSGNYLMDVDFRNENADSIQVAGSLSGSGVIGINNVTALTGAANASPGEIPLINSASGGGDGFILAEGNRYNNEEKLGRFEGTPFIWRLGTAATGTGVALGAAGLVNTEPTVVKLASTPREHVVLAEIPAYVTLPTFAREVVMTELDTMHQRLGELRKFENMASESVGESTDAGKQKDKLSLDESRRNGWIRAVSAGFEVGDSSSFEAEGSYTSLDIGADRKYSLVNGSVIFTGLFGGVSSGDFDNSGAGYRHNAYSGADVDLEAWSGGIYTTWFSSNGLYVDVVAQYMDMDSNIKAIERHSTDGWMLGGSIEVGKSFLLGSGLIVEPQLQLKAAHVNWEGFNDGYNDVIFDDHTYVMGRAGARVEKTIEKGEDRELKTYLYTGLNQDLGGSPDVNYVIDFESYEYGTTGTLEAGFTIDLSGRIKGYGNIGITSGFDDYQTVQGGVGIRFNF